MNRLSTAALSLAFAAGTIGIASAQQYPYPYQNGNQDQYRYHRHHRGSGNQQCNNNGYNNGYGYNNGGCATLQGTIVGVNGNQVTLDLNGQNYRSGNGDNDPDDNQTYNGNYNGGYNGGYYGRAGQRQITINDQPALDNRASGRVAVGRYVNASGYWQNGVFYATVMN